MTTTAPEATAALGHRLGTLLPPTALLLLEGELGAGKTCFVRGLARGLGVPEAEPIPSPSYTLMNQYQGRSPLYHFDLYRLHGREELEQIGYDDYLAGSGVTVVEWAERAGVPPHDHLRIVLRHAGEERRTVAFVASGAAFSDVVEALARAWPATGEEL
ncbi:MAG TPA: tRNA (adenosine(37)-N6)-threonylcarbamoyltransferase complex ATPase subunit type 1 TsaE [Desulfuromonas sp.]|nr:tRNA (adenosine(37)-N6)-threonylcarbamoyltransferase complex ATPase subunit type 1 TsaE [Desulfuromonas sp.]HBT83336.1 tRNA (adenosine(37)-N6)-threonylcarbamoyltransferase complex ATPase subunit type 1 TsaE [Desulfuromonas sp.]